MMKREHNAKRANAVKSGIAPTKERRQHNGGIKTEAVAKGVNSRTMVNRYRAVWECSLDVYRDSKIITGTEHRAGLRFRQAYHRAVLTRSAFEERWQPHTQTNTGRTMSERLIDEAYEALDDEEMNAVTTVCGYGGVIWGPRAIEKLRKGLGHLAVKWHSAAIEICE